MGTINATAAAMDKQAYGAGEELERAQRRRKKIIIGGLCLVGLVSGFLVGFHEGKSLFDGSTGWPPALALGIAFSYLAAIVGGSLALARHMDEVEIQAQAKAGSVAGAVYIAVYPLWFALWKGGFVTEPVHWVLFLLFWVALALSSLYYRYR
jgi:hypothetical protein